MLLLAKKTANGTFHRALIFGLGQIGTAIATSLDKLGFKESRTVAFDWIDFTRRRKQAERISAYLEGEREDTYRISIIWSAGNCGFHSTEQQTVAEYSGFLDVLGIAHLNTKSSNSNTIDFHLISSAGGLFENQRIVNLDSRPKPLRPYGRLKFRQENVARTAVGEGSLSIYRPSSVYGPMTQDTQRGLINNLIKNARNGRTTVLDSQVMSLRDYVYAGDVGNYVAHHVRWEGTGRFPREHFLVSSRCSSIFEVSQKVRKILNLNVYYTLDDRFGNNADITFHEEVMPKAWKPATLDYGIRQFALVD